MKKYLQMLLTAVIAGVMLLGSVLLVSAENNERIDEQTGKKVFSEMSFWYIQEGGSLTFIGYFGGNKYKTIVVPNAIVDPVSEIRSEAFLGADPERITAVYLPDTLMKIGENAFREGMRIRVYRSGDYRAFAAAGERLKKDPDVSTLTVLSDTLYYDLKKQDGVVYRLEGIEAVVSAYEGSGGEVRVAPEIGGLPVTTVKSGALTDSKITKIYLPSNVTAVEENAVGAVEVVFRADTDNPVVPTETPYATEPVERSVEIGTADIGTFDMSLGEFVTTEPAETEDPSESGKDGSESESGEGSKEADSKGASEGDQTEPGSDQPSEGGETEPASNTESEKTASPWLFVGIGVVAVALGIASTLFVRESLKRKRRHKNRTK